MEGEGYTCSLCYHFTAASMNAVLRHIGTVHSHEPGFQITCGINNCPKSYANYHSYRKHIRRKHMEHLEPEEVPEAVNFDSNFASLESSPARLNQWSRRSALLFVLKNKEVRQVSQLALNDLLQDVSFLVQQSLDHLSSQVTSVLMDNGINIQDIDGLSDVLSNNELRNPFCGLHSAYLQKKEYESIGLVKPIERKLGTTLKRSKGRYKLINECAYDIPLKESLKQLLSNEFLLDEVLRGHKNSDGFLEDYCDGLAFQEHLLYSSDSTALQVMLYYDDVEFVNPIGSKTKKHKLGAFYYLLGNFRPALRSALKTIQLITLVRQSYIKDYGIDKILEPFMESIRELESDDGIELEIGGHIYKFRGSISVVCADNLASWNLGGYKAMNSALRKCRFCMAVSDDMKSKFLSEDFIPRTRVTHSAHIEELSGPLHSHISTTFGLTRDSILNSSMYFHVTDGLAPDIMHDVLEGCLAYEMKELLKYIILDQGIMSLAMLNRKIENFAYGSIDAPNKPFQISMASLTSSDHSLKQSATQSWCLARILPLIVGPEVSEHEPHWENFLLMLTITDYVFSPIINEEVVQHLKCLIQEYLEMFCILYPNAPIIPKQHYLIHLPEWILRFGPAGKYWCMRFEAKHGYFKSLARSVRCFKNLAKTLAERHQNLMCYYATSQTHCNNEWDFGRVKQSVSAIGYLYKDALSSVSNITDETQISVVQWAKMGSTKYQRGVFVILQSSILPSFGEIIDVIVVNVDTCLFVIREYVTECLLHHYHAYEVSTTQAVSVHKFNEFVDYHPLTSYTLRNSKKVITLKYHIVEFLP